MKNLYETINNRAKDLKEDFDFTSNMNSLFSKSFQSVRDIHILPVEPEKAEWEEHADFGKVSLNRTFAFERHKHLRFFVSEVLKESDKLMHHPTLQVRKDSVHVELYTHDINDISKQDLNLSKLIDEIYEDVRFIEEF